MENGGVEELLKLILVFESRGILGWGVRGGVVCFWIVCFFSLGISSCGGVGVSGGVDGGEFWGNLCVCS